MSNLPKVVKSGDRYDITLNTGYNLDSANAVRLLARRQFGPQTPIVLEKTHAGEVVTHTLDGDLDTPGMYELEVEATIGTEVITFPTDQNGGPQVVYLLVVDDIA